jgi:hypothetical protein
VALSGFFLSLAMGSFIHGVFYIPAATYLLFMAAASVVIAQSLAQYFYLLVVIPTMHFAWGAGFITSPRNLIPADSSK